MAELDGQFWAILQAKYGSENAEAWASEEVAIKFSLTEIATQIGAQYVPDRPLNVGGGGIAVRVVDKQLSTPDKVVYAVLKLPRPVASQAREVNDILQRETERLRWLRHHNVIRIQTYGTSASGVHYYVMEYLDAPLDADEFLDDNPDLQTMIRILHGAASGLAYMHKSGIAHLDIKPGNIFVASAGESVVVADLGFAKRVDVSGETRYLGGTAGYKHPDHDHLIRQASLSQVDLADKNRELRRDAVRTSDIHKEWDIYSLGVTTLVLLRVLELSIPDVSSQYAYRYIRLMAYRMLGRNLTYAEGLTRGIRKFDERDPARLPLVNGDYLGLQQSTFQQIEYKTMDDILVDLDKILGTFDLLRNVPELAIQPDHVIQAASHGAVPFSDRIRNLVDTKEVRALGRVDQLGLVRLVYPSASHSRLEHSLGTLAMASRYARSLLADPISPIFKQLMTSADIETLLAMCLTHDIGHYPLAHDLEEVDREIFGHEQRTVSLLRRTGSELRQVLESPTWRLDVDRLGLMLQAGVVETPLSLKDMILKSIVDGPIDADKVDYLIRDSENLRLPYGDGIDVNKLTQCLTIVVNESGNGIQARLGIHDRGRIPAESLAFARYAMYGSVYWHRTHRTMKAMLNRIGFEVLHHERLKGHEYADHFRSGLYEFLETERTGQLTLSLEGLDVEAPASPYLDLPTQRIVRWLVSRLPEPVRHDYSLLADDLLFRRLYKRVFVLSRSRTMRTSAEWAHVETIFGRIGRNWSQRRDVTLELQRRIASEVARWDGVAREGFASVSLIEREKFAVDAVRRPLVLVDYPPTKSGSTIALEYLREDEWSGSQGGELRVDRVEPSSMWNALVEQYSVGLGKVRIFVHPDYAQLVLAAVPRDRLEASLWSALMSARA